MHCPRNSLELTTYAVNDCLILSGRFEHCLFAYFCVWLKKSFCEDELKNCRGKAIKRNNLNNLVLSKKFFTIKIFPYTIYSKSASNKLKLHKFILLIKICINLNFVLFILIIFQNIIILISACVTHVLSSSSTY